MTVGVGRKHFPAGVYFFMSKYQMGGKDREKAISIGVKFSIVT